MRRPEVGAGRWELAVTIVRGNFVANNGICNVYTMVKIETDTMLICPVLPDVL